MAQKKTTKFNRYLWSEVLLSTGDTPTLSVQYEHYKESELKEVIFLVNSDKMDNEQKHNYLIAIKKSLDTNPGYAMYKLKQRQEKEELKSTYEIEQETEEQADSLFIG